MKSPEIQFFNLNYPFWEKNCVNNFLSAMFVLNHARKKLHQPPDVSKSDLRQKTKEIQSKGDTTLHDFITNINYFIRLFFRALLAYVSLTSR